MTITEEIFVGLYFIGLALIKILKTLAIAAAYAFVMALPSIIEWLLVYFRIVD